MFYSNQQKLFPGNRKKQVGLHTVCGCTTYICPAPHLRLPKHRAKSCFAIWAENCQCFKKITGIEKAPCHFFPVGDDKGYHVSS